MGRGNRLDWVRVFSHKAVPLPITVDYNVVRILLNDVYVYMTRIVIWGVTWVGVTVCVDVCDVQQTIYIVCDVFETRTLKS